MESVNKKEYLRPEHFLYLRECLSNISLSKIFHASSMNTWYDQIQKGRELIVRRLH